LIHPSYVIEPEYSSSNLKYPFLKLYTDKITPSKIPVGYSRFPQEDGVLPTPPPSTDGGEGTKAWCVRCK